MTDEGVEQAERDEGAWRQHKQEHVAGLGQDGGTEERTSTNELAHHAEESQREREAESDAQPVEDAGQGRVLAGKGFSTPQDDAVHHDEWDEDAEALVDVGQIGLHDELQDGDEGGDDHHEHRYAHFVGREVLDAGYDEVGADEHRHRCHTHRQSVEGRGGRCQGGAHAEEKHERRVLLDDSVVEYLDVVHIFDAASQRFNALRRGSKVFLFIHGVGLIGFVDGFQEGAAGDG